MSRVNCSGVSALGGVEHAIARPVVKVEQGPQIVERHGQILES